LHMQV